MTQQTNLFTELSGDRSLCRDDYQGILTPKDRAFLRGELDLENSNKIRHRRYRIRERVRQALTDFELLHTHLSTADRRQIFTDLVAWESVYPAIALLSIGFYDLHTAYHDPTPPPDLSTMYEAICTGGAELSALQHGLVADIEADVELTVIDPDPQTIRDRILAENATMAEVRYLAYNGHTEVLEEITAVDDSFELYNPFLGKTLEFRVPEYLDFVEEHGPPVSNSDGWFPDSIVETGKDAPDSPKATAADYCARGSE